MNSKQRAILAISAVAIAAMLVYPPFHLVGSGGIQRPLGYSWIFSPPREFATVNIALLFAQWVGVGLVGGLVFLLLFGLKEHQLSEASSLPPNEAARSKSLIWNRFWARSIDFGVFLSIIAAVALGASIAGLPTEFTDSWIVNLITWSMLSTLLLAIMEAGCLSDYGTTPGKGVFRIYVVTADGENLGFLQAIKPRLFCFGAWVRLSSVLFRSCLCSRCGTPIVLSKTRE